MASLYRRGKTWWGRIQRNKILLRVSLKTTAKGIAERRFRAWLDELDAVAWGDKPRRKFDDAAERFVNEHVCRLRPKSALRYGVSLQWLADAFEGKYLDQITSAALAKFEDGRRAKGASPPTIRRDLACLSSIFGCCMEWEWTEANPVPAYFKSRRKRGLRESPPRTRYLSRGEEAKLIEAAREPLRSVLIVAIETGMRREEQFSLTWDQVDLASREIRLSGKTKSGKPRRVPITDRAVTILGTLPRHIRSRYVFARPNGERYVQMNKGLTFAVRRAGIAHTRWHDLRRTCGCRLLQDMGLSIAAVAMWLGHSSVTVTEKTYAFLEFENIKGMVTNMGTGATG